MYAIISDNGKQIKVEEGQEIDVDFREAAKGDVLKFDRILAISGEGGMKLGSPVVEGASVSAEVLGVEQGEKLVVQKFRRRKTFRRKNGHRQMYTRIRIGKIDGA